MLIDLNYTWYERCIFNIFNFYSGEGVLRHTFWSVCHWKLLYYLRMYTFFCKNHMNHFYDYFFCHFGDRQHQSSFTFIIKRNSGQCISPKFHLCPTEQWKKVMLVWNDMNCSFHLVLIGVCFYNGNFLWVNHYRSRYVCRIESRWLKRERNTPPVWIINTSRWMATVFAAIYFPGWSNYLLCGSSLMPLTKKHMVWQAACQQTLHNPAQCTGVTHNHTACSLSPKL